MPQYEYQCDVCGREAEVYQKIKDRNKTICTCGSKMKLLISRTALKGAESFNPHYDIQLGEYFETAEQKKACLAKEGKTQLSGQFSPRTTSKSQVICSKEQARAFDSTDKNPLLDKI